MVDRRVVWSLYNNSPPRRPPPLPPHLTSRPAPRCHAARACCSVPRCEGREQQEASKGLFVQSLCPP